MRRRTLGVLVAVLAVVALGFVFYTPLFLVETGEYQRASVSLHDENGTQLATVDVRIADTEDKRRVGLSRTDSLSPGSGMLFVHPESDTQTYVMRGMSFSIDIVFVAPNGTITRIHPEASPERIPTSQYQGSGKYVLEVPGGWMATVGAETGDVVRIPETVAPA